MHHYLSDPQTSLWNIEEFQGRKIGAQSYLGGVVGSNKDAMKNSDYGAMWMLANATQDTLLTKNVLPYALNSKFVQQISEPGFFNGSLAGQYYLAKSKKFVEEWGEVVEPIAVTYYTMLDLGNILLFEPNNSELKTRLRAGAEWLLKNLVKIDHPAIDYLLATTEKKDQVFVILLNNRAQATAFQISIKGAAAKARQLPALGFEILTITP